MDPKYDAAVDLIAKLGREAASFQVLTLTPPDNAIGLPKAVPFGFEHKSGTPRDLRSLAEQWRIFPERRRGVASVNTLASFIELVNRHKTEHSVIFAATVYPNPSLTAVINYHEKDGGKPAFGDHRVEYRFPVTEQFTAWAQSDGAGFNQGEFAAFIEERIAELATPTDAEDREFASLFQTKFANPAEMLALSRGLEVNVAGKVKNATRLSSGEGEIVFTEEHLDARGEKITVPGLFMVHVPAFLDGEPVRLPARLRYRVRDGAVTWLYQLYRWRELLRERVVADLQRATGETELPAYEGAQER